MPKLADQPCEPCSQGGKPLSPTALAVILHELPDWQILDEAPPKLQRQYTFKNFTDALAFTNAVAELAERFDHHPSITLEWGKTTVVWWTHKINNIHQADAIMAAKTDALYLTESRE